MLRLAADEDFNNDILRAVERRKLPVDLVRIQDAGLRTQDDLKLLEWCAKENRVLLTHDARTMPRHAESRMGEGQFMAGIVIVPQSLSFAVILSELALIVECSSQEEWHNTIRYLPLKAAAHG